VNVGSLAEPFAHSAESVGSPRPRLCENPSDAQLQGSFHPWWDRDRRSWGDL